MIRYSFYISNDFAFLESVRPLTKWLRLTAFLVLYPIGASGEGYGAYEAYSKIIAKRPWSFDLPNNLNFSIDSAVCLNLFFVFMPTGLFLIYTTMLGKFY